MSALGRAAYLDQSTIIKYGFVLGSGLGLGLGCVYCIKPHATGVQSAG